MAGEFQEIAHSGGKVTFRIRTAEDGSRGYQIVFSSDRPVPSVITGVYALDPGVPMGHLNLGGIGAPFNPPPVPGCRPVIIASDSQGMFGHQCPQCEGYWRSGPWPRVCPYCGLAAEGYQFLSKAQLLYVSHYCTTLADGLAEVENGDVTIDMDAVADATDQEGAKPAFYVAEENQQCKFECEACGEHNDILGRFGYCSSCGTRNDLQDLKVNSLQSLRAALNNGGTAEDAVRSAVGAFDTFVGQYAKQLLSLVPMSRMRRDRLGRQRFHNAAEVRDLFQRWFDIDIFKGLSEADQQFVVLMFFRRHLYEHNGGEVDQKYLDESGDRTVRLKQHIRESQDSAHRLIGLVQKMASNLHNGFHDLLPPIPEPIKAFGERQARMRLHQ